MIINCKNCGVHFKGNYCYNCSQKANTGRLNVIHVLEEFWHNMTHTDAGYFSLLKQMILRPGVVIREYIDGKRKKYFNPYTFYLVTTALLIFMTRQVFHYEDKLYEYDNEFAQYINLHYNYIVLCCLPVLGLMLMAIFRNRKYNYAEWITFLVFAYGAINFLQLVIQLFYFPLIRYHAEWKPYTEKLGYFLLFYILARFIRVNKWWEVLQCILVTAIIFFLVEVIGSLVTLWIYGMPFNVVVKLFKDLF